MIRKAAEGWLADIQPGGRGGKRYRKTFPTKAEALAWEAWLKTQVNQNPIWAPEKRDTRKISGLVELWYEHHGAGLRAGLDTKNRLLAICNALGDPLADRFKVEMFAEYRTKRLAAGVSANNLNREHAYMRSMFNELSRLGQWSRPNPLASLRQYKIQEVELSYLTSDQIRALLSALQGAKNPHVSLITKICLATGARWSEAEELRIQQLSVGQVQFARTKSGKTRSIPIDDVLFASVVAHHKVHSTDDRIFGPAWGAFREAIERAGISLPLGQMTHALRHTFASHFMINGGNILSLQRILGHSNLTMTIRYAHLAPDHLQEAKRLNPLAALHG